VQHKSQASGYPAHCKTDEQKKAYIADQHAQGIMLEEDKIKVNNAMRTLAKFELNRYVCITLMCSHSHLLCALQ